MDRKEAAPPAPSSVSSPMSTVGLLSSTKAVFKICFTLGGVSLGWRSVLLELLRSSPSCSREDWCPNCGVAVTICIEEDDFRIDMDLLLG